VSIKSIYITLCILIFLSINALSQSFDKKATLISGKISVAGSTTKEIVTTNTQDKSKSLDFRFEYHKFIRRNLSVKSGISYSKYTWRGTNFNFGDVNEVRNSFGVVLGIEQYKLIAKNLYFSYSLDASYNFTWGNRGINPNGSSQQNVTTSGNLIMLGFSPINLSYCFSKRIVLQTNLLQLSYSLERTVFKAGGIDFGDADTRTHFAFLLPDQLYGFSKFK
jgi:hypothetical protein